MIGDLAPAANEFIYSKYVKPLILKTWDITYVEYHRRGLETLPEEIPAAFDWMDRHRRDPYPKSFKVNTARTSDDRFYGVVIREFAAGRTTAPEAAEVLGQNLNPATIKMKSSSSQQPDQAGRQRASRRLDVWLSPKLIDFKRKVGGPDQRQVRSPPGQAQARHGADARGPPRPRRPAAALLAPDFGRDGSSGRSRRTAAADGDRRLARLLAPNHLIRRRSRPWPIPRRPTGFATRSSTRSSPTASRGA